MKKIEELKKDLAHGDYKIIQKLSKVPLKTINAIMSGARKSDTPTGEKIRKAAQMLIDSRNALLDSADEEQPELPFPEEIALPNEY